MDGPLPVTPTGTTIPAGQLLPGHQYAYELGYSSRIHTASPDANVDAQIGFELRTTGNFTTAAAVPEPAAAWLMLGGMGLMALRIRPRR